MNRRHLPTALAAALVVAAIGCPRADAATPEFTLAIKDHRFAPAELVVPAGQKVRVIVENQDPTPEEFESYTLNREKVVVGNSRIVLFVGPLEPGRYEFFGDFNQATARGWLVAR
jgi:hypothetical protein